VKIFKKLIRPHPSGLDVLTPSTSGEGYNKVNRTAKIIM
jgi:hypothetical protein